MQHIHVIVFAHAERRRKRGKVLGEGIPVSSSIFRDAVCHGDSSPLRFLPTLCQMLPLPAPASQRPCLSIRKKPAPVCGPLTTTGLTAPALTQMVEIEGWCAPPSHITPAENTSPFWQDGQAVCALQRSRARRCSHRARAACHATMTAAGGGGGDDSAARASLLACAASCASATAAEAVAAAAAAAEAVAMRVRVVCVAVV